MGGGWTLLSSFIVLAVSAPQQLNVFFMHLIREKHTDYDCPDAAILKVPLITFLLLQLEPSYQKLSKTEIIFPGLFGCYTLLIKSSLLFI